MQYTLRSKMHLYTFKQKGVIIQDLAGYAELLPQSSSVPGLVLSSGYCLPLLRFCA